MKQIDIDFNKRRRKVSFCFICNTMNPIEKKFPILIYDYIKMRAFFCVHSLQVIDF